MVVTPRAGYTLLRLPLTVEPVFLEWLERTQPGKRAKVEGRIRDTRDGKLRNSAWGERMRGSGEIADQIKNLFEIFVRKHGLNRKLPPLPTTGHGPEIVEAVLLGLAQV